MLLCLLTLVLVAPSPAHAASGSERTARSLEHVRVAATRISLRLDESRYERGETAVISVRATYARDGAPVGRGRYRLEVLRNGRWTLWQVGLLSRRGTAVELASAQYTARIRAVLLAGRGYAGSRSTARLFSVADAKWGPARLATARATSSRSGRVR